MKTNKTLLRWLPKSTLFLFLFCIVTGPLSGQTINIAFNGGPSQDLLPGANVSVGGTLSNFGAAGYYTISVTNLVSDVNLLNLAVGVDGIIRGPGDAFFLNSISNTPIALFGLMPEVALPCHEAKVRIDVQSITGPLVGNYTYTARAVVGPTNAPDLIIRDDIDDIGAEPYIANPEFASPDLWVRRQADGVQSHQNPDFVSITGNANKVYTIVRNVGCLSSSDADLHLYWTRARTHETWDDHWLHYTDPSAPNNFTIWPSTSTTQRPLGGELTLSDPTDPTSASSPVNIPPLNRGQVYTIPPVDWFPPNPAWYQNDGDPIIAINGDIHPAICLLARIVSPNDPMRNELNPRDIVFNVRDNNNIATRNTYLTNDPAYKMPPDEFGNYSYGFTSYEVNNPTGGTQVVDLDLTASSEDTDNSFLEYGNVNIALSNNLWTAWQNGGLKSDGVTIISPGLVRMTDPTTARLEGISLPPGAQYTIAFQYEFFGSVSVSEDLLYNFQLTQYPSGSATYTSSPNHMLTRVERNARKNSPVETAPALLMDMNAYPNPAGDAATVSFTLTEGAKINLVLRDLQGREVVRLANGQRYEAGLHSLPIDLSDLSTGVYLLQFQAAGTFVTKKLAHTAR